MLISCIQVNADANHSSEKGVMLFCVDFHLMQAVVIQNPVVNSFCRGALIVDFLISLRTAGDIGVETDIPFRFRLNNPAIF